MEQLGILIVGILFGANLAQVFLIKKFRKQLNEKIILIQKQKEYISELRDKLENINFYITVGYIYNEIFDAKKIKQKFAFKCQSWFRNNPTIKIEEVESDKKEINGKSIKKFKVTLISCDKKYFIAETKE